jgi:hypothetical protein
VLTRYKADTSDHKRKLKDLSGAQKKRMKETIKGLEEENRSLDKSISKWGKMAAGVAAVGAAYLAARESMKAYVEDAQLKHAAAGISIDKLKKSSHGLLTELQLMQLAAAGVNNEWGASQEQLNAVANWITVLYHKGNDLNEVFQTMKKSIAEGGVEELQKFGEQLRGVNGMLAIKGEEGFNALMQRANESIGRFSSIAGDDAVKASTKMQDSMRNLKVQFGELATALVPVINRFAQLIGKMAEGIAQAGDFWDAVRLNVGSSEWQVPVKGYAGQVQLAKAVEDMPGLSMGMRLKAQRHAWIARQRMAEEAKRRAVADAMRWTQPPPGAGGPAGPAGAGRRAGGGMFSGIGGRFGAGGIWGGPDFGAIWDRMRGPEVSPMRPTPFGAEFEQAPILGDRMIGQQSEFDRLREEYMPQMQEGAGMFAQSMQAAFTAVISGSGNAAKAFKEAMGQMLAGKAALLFGEAIYSGVMAFIEWSPKRAADAAKAGAGALALAGMARALGYGGNVPGQGGSATAGGTRLGGSPTRTGTNTKVVILGDSYFDGSDPRRQAAKLRRVLGNDDVIGS